MRLQRPFLSSPLTFLFPLLRVRINFSKIKDVLLFCFCVSFSPHSLECYFFFLDPFLKSIFFQFYSSIFDWLGIEFYNFFQWCLLILMTQVTSLKC